MYSPVESERNQLRFFNPNHETTSPPVNERAPPKLNLNHGFVHQIRAYQQERAKQTRPFSNSVPEPTSPAVRLQPAQLATKSVSDEHITISIDTAPDVILKAIQGSMISSVNLQNFARVLVEKSCEDHTYTADGAKLCTKIVKEVKSANLTATKQFVGTVAESCRQRLDVAEETRNRSVEKWVSLVRFLTECYRSKEELLTGAVRMLLLEVLMNLTRPPCCLNRIEVDALYNAVVYCGKDLKTEAEEYWNQVAFRLEDSFINIPPSSVVSARLLRCIEIISSDWRLL